MEYPVSRYFENSSNIADSYHGSGTERESTPEQFSFDKNAIIDNPGFPMIIALFNVGSF